MLLLLGCESEEPPRLRVLAASSLRPLAGPGPGEAETEISVGASSVLAMQLLAGAKADVVLMADELWMDELEAGGIVVPGSRVEIARNRIVLVAASGDDPKSVNGIPPGRIAIAEPGNVPLGRYSREALRSLGWWPDLQERLVLASDARAVLALVEAGEVDAGIVYASDASQSREVEVLQIFDSGLHRPIRCEVARISDRAAARDFIDHLRGPAGQARIEALGFLEASDSGGRDRS